MPAALSVLPAGLVLVATALAERAGAETAVFYLFLLGVAVTAASGLAAFGRVIDAANGGGTPVLGRLQGALAALLVAVCVVGAVGRSPIAQALGAPGLAPSALGLGFVVLVLLAFASLAPVKRSGAAHRRGASRASTSAR